MEESESRQSASGFGVWLVTTPDQDWQEKWNTPPEVAPRLTTASEVRRGGSLAILILVANPQPDENNRLRLACDIKVIRPDGSISIEMPNINCMDAPLVGPPANIRLADAGINFIAEPEDISGVWRVQVNVRDINRGITVLVKTAFTLID